MWIRSILLIVCCILKSEANVSSTLDMVPTPGTVSELQTGFDHARATDIRFSNLQQGRQPDSGSAFTEVPEAAPIGFIGALLILIVYHSNRSRA